MEFIAQIFEIGKNMWEEIGKWIGYLNNLDTNMQNLKRKIEDLSRREEDIETELTSAEHQPGKRAKKEVEGWVRDVQKTKDDVQTIEQEVIAEWNYVSRARLGKLVEGKIQEVAELQERGRFSDGLLINAPPSPSKGKLIPKERFFSEIASARNLKKVWEYLMDGKFARIGIVGMGGAGKTTIMKEINNRIVNEGTSYFDEVIWVTVSKASKEFNITKIQDAIARKLGLDLSKYEDEMDRASELCTMLSKKRYLLILDDVWETFGLDMVGVSESIIPNSAKLVLTTRSQEVCTKMGCVPVKVELLTEVEARDLFLRTVALDETKMDTEVREIIEKVTKECACLPLAIITIAGSMRGKGDKHTWRKAFRDISRNEIKGDVLELLKFSYIRLKNEKLQKCFLYCALFPEDHYIPKNMLIGYWIAEGLIDEMDSRQEMIDEGYCILDELINTFLLESCIEPFFREESVKMHDLIRDMALKVTKISSEFLVRAGEELEEFPCEFWSEDPKKVSLMHNKIEVLPTSPPIFHRLTTLHLNDNTALCDIPDSFFLETPLLKVLDLSCTNIKSLPESISNLENLQALLVGGTVTLEYVPSLEKLTALKELNLHSTGIREIPQGIEELVSLRNLCLHRTRQLKSFPGCQLRRLSRLQCLQFDISGVEVLVEDLLCLRQLKVLCAQFQNVKEVTRYVKSHKFARLENYRLLVGILDFRFVNMEKEVSIRDSEIFSCGVDELVVPSDMETLMMGECHFCDMVSLSDVQSLKDATNLKTLWLEACSGIESVFSEDYLRSIEFLTLLRLRDLRVLFDRVGPPSNISFTLKKLEISGCSSIKSVFPAAILLQNFPNLRTLWVFSCETVEEIIVDDEVHNQNGICRNLITLPSLLELSLSDLPRLKSICKGVMLCKSLQSIHVERCPMLRRLPLSSVAAPTLQVIRGNEEWWGSLEWDDICTKTTLQPLFRIW